MSCQKRKAGKDEKITNPSPAKKGCFQLETKSPSKKNTEQTSSCGVRMYTDQEKRKILEILEAEFDKELTAKEEEVIEIQERIIKTQKILQYLCYAVVSDFYSREKTITSVASTRQRRIHPAVKKLLSGKGPPGASEVLNVTTPADGSSTSTSYHSIKHEDTKDDDILAQIDSPTASEVSSGKEKKVPRYIPPKPKPKPITGNQSEPTRGGQNKVKTILVVGNVSKWLQADMRDDSASHKWMVYVRGPKGDPDISSFVSKVRFFLHPSYRPNDVVQVVCPPFQLSRRGWGEFPIRVQVHFSNSFNKPVDIIHNLKLDRTHSGFQTLGSETVAEVWIHREFPKQNTSTDIENQDELQTVKNEPPETNTDSCANPCEETDPLDTSIPIPISIKTETVVEENTVNCEPFEFSRKNIYEESETTLHLPSTSGSRQENLPVVLQHEKAAKIKMESSSENSHDTLAIAGFSESDSKQVESLSSIDTALFSPSKLLSPANSPRIISASQQSPSKLGILNTSGAPFRISPAKPGTQLVKCVDSKGAVRILQVRTDLLPKILKRGSATIPVTPPVAAEGAGVVTSKSMLQTVTTQALSQKIVANSLVQTSTQIANLCTSASKALLQTDANQLVPQNTVTKLLPQSAVAQVLPQAGAPKVPAQNMVPKILPQSVVTKAFPASSISQVQNATMKLVSQSSLNQAISQNKDVKVVPQSVVAQVCSPVAVTSPVKLLGAPPGTTMASGSRPILRLVRPTGNVGARPLLVAANPTNQILRLPASASANGNRPLLVLKDGKLFMMKSALDAATKGTSASVVNTCEKVTENPMCVKQSVHQSSPTVTSTTFTSTIAKPISTASTSSVLSAVIPLVNQNSIPKPENSSNPSTVASTAVIQGLPLKPKTSISIPPVVRFSSPQLMQTPNKIKAVSSQTTPRVAVKSGKSLLKPAVSLLKSNFAPMVMVNKSANIQTPANVNSSMKPPPSIPPAATVHSATTTTPNKRVILGRNSGSSTITPYSKLSIYYREQLRFATYSCPKDPEENIERALRWLIRNLPLASPAAKNLEYKILHPYCAPDERTFCSWNIGKQRACEWQRAQMVHVLLGEAGWDLRTIVSIKEIILWARTHGYTPGLPLMKGSRPNSASGDDSNDQETTVDRCSKVIAVEEWLDKQEHLSSTLSSVMYSHEMFHLSDESDVEVDIVSDISSPSQVKVKQEHESSSLSKDDTLEEMPLEPNLQPIADLVTKSLNKVGVTLSSEEIIPGTKYSGALRVLVQAVQSLVEDLGRRALSEAWGEDNRTCRPESIEASDVSLALSRKSAFDILTCSGLGITSVTDSFPSS